MPSRYQRIEFLKVIVAPLMRMISYIPIYGQLVDTKKKHLHSATCDVFITTLFSLLPLWLYPLFSLWTFDFSLETTFKALTSNGEFFLYSAALVGPLIYSITKRYGLDDEEETGDDQQIPRRKIKLIKTIEFPYGRLFIIISVFTCLFAALFFSVMQASSQLESDIGVKIPLERDNLFFISALMYIFTLSCLFCVSVYRLDLENIPKRINEDTHNFVDEWNQRYD